MSANDPCRFAEDTYIRGQQIMARRRPPSLGLSGRKRCTSEEKLNGNGEFRDCEPDRGGGEAGA